MGSLLLRLAAPMQSWGVSSKFDRRMTNMEPSKSGVIGLIASAMGIGREESLGDLISLKFGVRIDQPGILERDFQMVHPVNGKDPWVTHRYYLGDAVFLAAVECDTVLLKNIEWALKNPVYPLFLGRRSCPPAGQLCLGIRETGMRDSLRQEAWQASPWYQKRAKYRKIKNLEIVRDAEVEEDTYEVLRDEPKSFSQLRRKYNFRNVIREHIPLQAICKDMGDTKGNDISTEHDPMALWEGYDVSFKSED